MTNPLVAFGSHHKCRARGFASGGAVEDAKAVGDRMCKEYGVGCKPKAAEPPAPAPQAQVAPSPAANSGGMIGAVKNIFANRAAQIDKAAGYAFGGAIRDGNSFTQDLANYNPLTSIGGPKDRFGNDMTFTNGMKSQLQAIAAPSAPATTPAATTATPPATPPATQNPLTAIAPQQSTPFNGAYTPGSANDTHKAFARGGRIKGPGTPTSDSIPAEVNETGEPIKVSTDERILSKAQDAFLEKVAKDLGFESLEEMLEAGTGQPVGPTINVKRGAATGGKFDETDPNRERGFSSVPTADEAEIAAQRRATTPPTYSAAAGSLSAAANQTSDQNKAFAERFGVLPSQDGPVLRAMHGKPEQKAIAAQSNESTGGLPTPLSSPSLNYSAPVLGDQGRGVPVGHNPAPTASATDVDGVRRINVAGQSPVYTNLDTETALKGLSAVKSGAPSISSISINGTDGGVSGVGGDAGPSVLTLRDTGRAESQALMDKWGREDAMKEMVAEMWRNPKAANALASLYHSWWGTEASLADSANRRDMAAATDDTTRRGQDFSAQNNYAQLAGNPIDNALKRTQLTSANMAIDKAREQDKVLAKIHAETDSAKRQALIEELLAGQGKNVNEHRFIKVDGGEETNNLGEKYKKPSGVFDAVTKQFIPMGAGAAGRASAASPYPNGTRLTGPDGKAFIVRNGKPEPV